MRAVTMTFEGEWSVATLVSLPMPEPGAGEALVRIRAAGVNPSDWQWRPSTRSPDRAHLPIAGTEFAGVIIGAGRGVSTDAIGKHVYGIINSGAFADYAVVPISNLASMPSSLGFIEAASIPVGALAGWQAVIDIAGTFEQDRVFITNGSGAVGSMAVQIAKSEGAHVTAMASSNNEDYVLGLGADEFVDREADPLDFWPRAVDVVIDTADGDTFRRALNCLRPGGLMVTSACSPQTNEPRCGIAVEYLRLQPDCRQLAEVAALVDGHKLATRVGAVACLSDINDALALARARSGTGKVVVSL